MKLKILQDFDGKIAVLSRFKDKCSFLLQELLRENEIQFHQIEGRVKERNSLSKKIDFKEGKYNELNDITDLVGLRIITYLDSDVDKIARIIEQEFSIDINNSVDKRKQKIDQFGYRSLHYVVELDTGRLKNTENKSFVGLKAELQIRSILQHAWAEIEHDLGYKGEASVAALPIRFGLSYFLHYCAVARLQEAEFDSYIRDNPSKSSMGIEETKIYYYRCKKAYGSALAFSNVIFDMSGFKQNENQ